MGRVSFQRMQVSRASKPHPIRILTGLLMAPPTHLIHGSAIEKSPGCPAEGGYGWGWVPVALHSREPCKELGLGFPSGNLSS